MSKTVPIVNYSQYYNTDFMTLDQMQSEYDRINRMRAQRLNANDYVPTTAEYLGNASSFASAGASIGGMIDPVWGTIAGGVIGAGAGLIKTGIDENNIRNEVDTQNTRNTLLADEARRRVGYSADILQNNLFRQSEAHAVANGGQIQRKQITMQEFADKVLGKKHSMRERETQKITRTYCKGGVKISFK